MLNRHIFIRLTAALYRNKARRALLETMGSDPLLWVYAVCKDRHILLPFEESPFLVPSHVTTADIMLCHSCHVYCGVSYRLLCPKMGTELKEKVLR